MPRFARFIRTLTAATAFGATVTASTPVAAADGFIADGPPGSFAHEFAARLYHRSLPEAESFAREHLDDAGQSARFALGIAQFLKAVEGLAQDLHRHGLRQSVLDVPVLRLPVPPNPNPEPIDYQGFRTILDDFVVRLAEAEATLSDLEGDGYMVPLRPVLARLDLDGDGTYAQHERLDAILFTILGFQTFGGGFDQEEYRDFMDEFLDGLSSGDPDALAELDAYAPVFGFDAADATWLRGYSHLLSAMMQIVLAQDWQMSFESTFHIFFQNADTPTPELAETYMSTMDMRFPQSQATFYAFAFDVAAFAIHSPWTTTEPERMRAARMHLKDTIRLSRETWDLIGAETDSPAGTKPEYNEWIPSPDQFQWLEGLPVSVRTIEGWQEFLNLGERVLDGELLIPHWRFDKGINVRRLFDEGQELSPILMLQGSAVLPFLEEGEIADNSFIEPILALMDGNLMGYAVWFN